jgi:hypothetical protein
MHVLNNETTQIQMPHLILPLQAEAEVQQTYPGAPMGRPAVHMYSEAQWVKTAPSWWSGATLVWLAEGRGVGIDTELGRL